MEQEKWIKSVLNSTNGITKVAPDDTLLSRIQERINAKEIISLRIGWAIAASFAILFSINIYLLSSSSKKDNVVSSVFAFEINKSNQLYTNYE